MNLDAYKVFPLKYASGEISRVCNEENSSKVI